MFLTVESPIFIPSCQPNGYNQNRQSEEMFKSPGGLGTNLLDFVDMDLLDMPNRWCLSSLAGKHQQLSLHLPATTLTGLHVLWERQAGIDHTQRLKYLPAHTEIARLLTKNSARKNNIVPFQFSLLQPTFPDQLQNWFANCVQTHKTSNWRNCSTTNCELTSDRIFSHIVALWCLDSGPDMGVSNESHRLLHKDNGSKDAEAPGPEKDVQHKPTESEGNPGSFHVCSFPHGGSNKCSAATEESS